MSFFSFRKKSFNSFDLLSLSIPLQAWEPFGTPYLNFTFLSLGIFIVSVWYNNLLFKASFLTIVKRYSIYLLIWWAILFIQSYNNDYVGSITSFSIPRQFLLSILLFVTVSNIMSRYYGYSDRFFHYYNIGLIIITVLYFLGIDVSDRAGRIQVMGENPNNLAAYFFIGIAYLSYRLIVNRDFKYLVLLIPFLFMLLNTGSRTGLILTFLVPVFIILTSELQTRERLRLIGLSFLLLVAILTLTLNNDLLINRFLTIEQEIEEGNQFGYRLPIWQNALDGLQKNVFWGLGTSGHEYYVIYESGFRDKPRGMHNTFLQVLTYTGIVGFFLFVTFLFKVFRIAKFLGRVYKDSLLISFFISIMVFGFSTDWTVNLSIWMIFSIIVGKFLFLKKNFHIHSQKDYLTESR